MRGRQGLENSTAEPDFGSNNTKGLSAEHRLLALQARMLLAGCHKAARTSAQFFMNMCFPVVGSSRSHLHVLSTGVGMETRHAFRSS